MNKSYELPLTNEEIEAIREYAGITHVKINCIADLDYDKQQQLKENNWNVDMKTEELEENIKRFVNIYSAIYKAGTKGTRSTLYRATNKQQIEEIKRKKEIASCTSTALKEEYAKSKYFGGYGKDAVILRLRKEGDLPSLYIEPYKIDTGLDEEEVLILPFTKVKKIEHTSDWNGYAYYDAILEKENLEEVPKEQLETSKTQLLEGYDEYKTQVNTCIDLERKIEDLHRKIIKNDEGPEIQRLKKAELSEVSKQYSQIRKTVCKYQEDFKKMIKGMCKEKELEIDQQREEIQMREIEEKRKRDKEHLRQLETEIANLENQVRNGKIDIIDTLEQCIGEVEETSLQYRTIAEDLKIGYSQNLHFKVLEVVQNIKTKLKRTEEMNKEQQEENENYKAKRDRLQEQYGDLLQQKEQIEQIQKQIQKLPQFIREHKRESFQEIKANLNTKVQGMITKARVTHLQMEKQQVLQEKESRLQRLFYGTTLKEQKIANIEAKIELERKQAIARNPQNSVGVMMANLYDCSAQDLNGQFSPEMVETIYAIRRNFDKLPNEQMLAKQAYQKAIGNYPAILGTKRISKRKQINYYRQDTEKTKVEICNSTLQNKPIHKEVKINALSKFEQSINYIKAMIERNEESSYVADRNALQSGRDIA